MKEELGKFKNKIDWIKEHKSLLGFSLQHEILPIFYFPYPPFQQFRNIHLVHNIGSIISMLYSQGIPFNPAANKPVYLNITLDNFVINYSEMDRFLIHLTDQFIAMNRTLPEVDMEIDAGIGTVINNSEPYNGELTVVIKNFSNSSGGLFLDIPPELATRVKELKNNDEIVFLIAKRVCMRYDLQDFEKIPNAWEQFTICSKKISLNYKLEIFKSSMSVIDMFSNDLSVAKLIIEIKEKIPESLPIFMISLKDQSLIKYAPEYLAIPLLDQKTFTIKNRLIPLGFNNEQIRNSVNNLVQALWNLILEGKIINPLINKTFFEMQMNLFIECNFIN